MYKLNQCSADHSIQASFHEPCEKDLRVSYLEQYQLNGTHSNQMIQFQATRDKSRNTLKQITDKYGFFWDEKGRLFKIKDNSKIKPVKKQTNFIKQELSFQKRKQAKGRRPEYKHSNIMKQQKQNLKQQIETIDQKINSIVGKYTKKAGQNLGKKVQDFHLDRHTNIKCCQCNLKQRSPFRERMQTEQNCDTSSFLIDDKKVDKSINIVRSKSAINLVKQYKNKKCQPWEVQHHLSKYQQIVQPLENRNILQNNCRKQKEGEIDNKIDIINKKIKQCEKQKQKLNISFKKFEVRQRSKTPEKRISCNIKDIKRTLQRGQSQLPKKYALQIKKQNTEKKPIPITSIQAYEGHGEQAKRKSLTTKKGGNQSTIEFENSSIQVKNIGKLKQDEKGQKDTNKNIISLICKQIQIDEEFRSAKLWLENNEDPHKWGILSDKLQIDGINFKYHELVENFTCSPEQHNPFFSGKRSFQNYASLVKKFKSQESFWRENIQNSFTTQELYQQQFTERELDIEQKGFIKIEDLVRFINMRTKNFYRTRDLLLIFRRIAGKNKSQIEFQKILGILTF